jgi:hypothetical protein
MNFGVIAVTLSLELSIALACNASESGQRKSSRPLYPQKRTCAVQLGMSALCQ